MDQNDRRIATKPLQSPTNLMILIIVDDCRVVLASVLQKLTRGGESVEMFPPDLLPCNFDNLPFSKSQFVTFAIEFRQKS